MADIFVSFTLDDRNWAFWIGQELLKLGHETRMNGRRNITAASKKALSFLP
ncbi:MAG TPA: hypothetical protein VN926_03530 [Bradyrhizobium sp.]|nr:hypothetical protein [Bradyrhizobium sp.]